MRFQKEEIDAVKSDLMKLSKFGPLHIGSMEGLNELPSDGSSRCFTFSLDLLIREGFTNAHALMTRFEGAILPLVRVCTLEPSREFFPHIDANIHDLFKPTPKGHIMSASINIVATPNSTSTTHWYRQKDLRMLHPWASYVGDGKPNLEKIDEMVVNDVPVLFKTGQWHSINNDSSTDSRIVSSLFVNHTIGWDGAVALFSERGWLEPRY